MVSEEYKVFSLYGLSTPSMSIFLHYQELSLEVYDIVWGKAEKVMEDHGN